MYWKRHEDWQLAQVCSTVANSAMGKKRKALKPTDFMRFKPDVKKKDKNYRQPVEQQIALAKAITLAFGGTIKPKKKK